MRRLLLVLTLLAAPALAEPLAVTAEAGRLLGAESEPRPGQEILARGFSGAPMRLVVTAARDAGAPGIRLYELDRPEGGAWCNRGPDGQAAALAIPGHWDERLTWVPPAGPADFHLSCTAGAIGKCVLAGYAPWRGAALGPLLTACVRMFRADYGGDGQSWTRDGMLIAWEDEVVHPGGMGTEMPFEAGWGPGGAVCLAHARVPEVATREAILARYPHLAGDCDAAAARARGALLLNRSQE
ncbi:ADYC domain-containing protein [Falsiroseomonas sp. HW251]|uniref:ADYC domain-containing protein n=1 Tax=Falsiroseomonas sp. HW251 TaxID=3390998 RepID=UPI003D3115D6